MTYCQSDVELLRLGCEKFQEEFTSIVGKNPMETRITIASACNMAYRMKWLPFNKIAIEPYHGWRPNHKHSRTSLEWLCYEESQLREMAEIVCQNQSMVPHIQHAGNEGEKSFKIGSERAMSVDGYNSLSGTVYEFQGCFYHGCSTCFPNRHQSHFKHEGKTMQDVWDSTQDKIKKLKSLGLKVVEMWECEWEKKKETHPEVEEFVKRLEFSAPLNPRDAFFGGRTNAICLAKQVEPGEKILYDDIRSLYPWVNKNCDYPVGHPIYIDQPPGTDISNYFGLLKVKIIPPRGLYHAVLPSRHGNKLTFPLCRTCLELEQPKPIHQRSCSCSHSDEERALTGTWCSPELHKAVEKGYRVVYVYEVWHFEQKSDALFKTYINTFLKMKMEASGWPSDVGDDPDKQDAFIREFGAKEGIELEPANMMKNEGQRALSKLMLNSFWGKFGQRPNMTRCRQFSSAADFFSILT